MAQQKPTNITSSDDRALSGVIVPKSGNKDVEREHQNRINKHFDDRIEDLEDVIDSAVINAGSGDSNHTTLTADPTNFILTDSGDRNYHIDIATGGIGSTELASTAVTAGDYGDDDQSPTFTVDADGRLTAAADVHIPITTYLTAGEGLSAGDFVGVNSSGQAILADATSIDTAAIGYVKSNFSSSATAKVYMNKGVLSGLSGLTAGKKYFLSSSTPGGLVAQPTLTGTKIVQHLGTAISSTSLAVDIDEAYRLYSTLAVTGSFTDTTTGSPMGGSLTVSGGVPPYTLQMGWTAPSGSVLTLSTATITDTGATDTVALNQMYSGTVQDSEGATATFSGAVDVAAGLTYATWDSAAKGTSVALSNGDLTSTISSTGSTNRSRVRCTAGKSSGKWFFAIRRESTAGIGGNLDIGIGNAAAVYTGTPGYLGLDANTWGHLSDGYKAHSGFSAYGSSWDTVGDIVCCAIDIDAGKIWFGKWNGSSITWFGTGSPSAGTDPAFSGLAAGTYYAFNAGFRSGVDAESDAAFGGETFGLTPPSGFSWWTDP